MKSEKLKAESRLPSPKHYIREASTSSTKTGNSGESHPRDNKPSSFIDETIDFWQKRTGKTLSRVEAIEAITNINNFFRVLADWDTKARKTDSKPPKEI
jgi:hypothetical protein